MRLRAMIIGGCLFLFSGCAAPWASRLTLPDRYTLVHDPLEIHSDFHLIAHHRLVDDLISLRTDLSRRLEIPDSQEPIHVYLFENPERFQGFMKLYHPEFPERRAFFVETDVKLSVYAQWGDRVSEDLRHELTHAYLHAIVPNLPLWLDEGLAEFHEVPRRELGLNHAHLCRLKELQEREHWQPDLDRLEKLDPDREMSQDDYAEAWGWTYFLLLGQPEHATLLRGYLHDLQRHATAAPFSIRLRSLTPEPEKALAEFLRELKSTP
ncbi:MAG: DUF1570 domain-containing protein [Pirellulales bacterium]|nr:DUF1570 domain-containing protein [Pirellulales bacterium]